MKHLLLFLIAVFGMLRPGLSQTASSANYAFTTGATESLVDMSTGTTTRIANGIATDFVVSNIPIGFDFYLMGQRFTTFGLNTSGIIRLGTTVIGAAEFGSITGTLASPEISPFAARASTQGAGSKVHSKVIGTAPNRTLVIENLLTSTFYAAGAPNSTFQVQLSETTGQIKFVYGTMLISRTDGGTAVAIGFNAGSATNALVAINAPTHTASTTAPFTNNAQPANGTYTPLNSTANGSRRFYGLAPPATSGDPTNLVFSAIGYTNTTLSWTDNASNEVGYVIFRSTDNGATYTYVTTVAANTTTYVASGLTANTNYTYKVNAITEGGVSADLVGSQITTPLSVFTNYSATSSITATDGIANVTATGGTVPYTYLWSNGATTSSISGLAPGKYTVTVTDAATIPSIQKRIINIVFNASISNWGANGSNAFGNGSGIYISNPAITLPFASQWKNVAAGTAYTMAIKADSTLWGWGANASGQIGNSNAVAQPVPVKIGSDKWQEISALNTHTLGIKVDGSLWAWGLNNYGQLGNNTTTTSSTPLQPTGTAAYQWIAVATGEITSYALRADGTIWAWGYNLDGRVGDGTGANKSVPVQIGTANDWAQIAGGNYTGFAIKADGTLYGWGYNVTGHLGDGTVVNKLAPVVISAGSTWANIAGGLAHTAGIKTNGSLWTWGSNAEGQIGDGTIVAKTSPVQIGSATNWTSIGAAYYNTQAVNANGELWSWGDNASGTGTLGDGSFVDKTSPVKISAPNNKYIFAAGGAEHNAALVSTPLTATANFTPASSLTGADGTVTVNAEYGIAPYTYVWSTGATGTTITNLNPGFYTVTVTDALGATQKRQVYVTAAEGFWASGINTSGTFGNGNLVNSSVPRFQGNTILDRDVKYKTIASGFQYTLAIKPDSTLWSWGYNNYGMLGDATGTARSAPVKIGIAKWAQIATYESHSIGIQADGSLWIWGRSDNYQTGNNATTSVTIPSQPTGVAGFKFTAISATASASLALRSDGTIWAVGYNADGELGDSSTVLKGLLVQIRNDNDWMAINSGTYQTFGIKANGTLWSWGYNAYRQLGTAITGNRITPTQVGTATNWLQADGGVQTSVGLQSNGTIWSWGTPTVGETGQNVATTASVLPTQIGTATDWGMISASNTVAHALKTNGTLYGWGSNAYGQIGDSTLVNKLVPTISETQAKFSYLQTGQLDAAMLGAASPQPGVVITTPSNPTTITVIPVTITFDQQVTNFIQGDITITGGTISAFTAVAGATTWTMIVTPTSLGTPIVITIAAGSVNALVVSGLPNTGGALTISTGLPISVYPSSTPVSAIGAADGTASVAVANGTAPYSYLWSNGSTDSTIGGLTPGRYTVTVKGADDSTQIRNIDVVTVNSFWAWGINSYSEFGGNNTTGKIAPFFPQSDTISWKFVWAGNENTFGIKPDSSLWAWGLNNYAQLGDGTVTQRTTPVQIGGATSKWATISSNLYHTLGIKADGSLWAWGENGANRLGDGTVAQRPAPIQPTGTAAFKWVSVSASDGSSYAVRADGTLWAWGYNVQSQVGDGTAVGKTVPTQIGTESHWVSVSSGGYSAFAIKDNGTLWAWGYNNLSQLGDGTTVNRAVPTQIGTATWKNVSEGFNYTTPFTMGVQTNGTLWGWGTNANGQLGGGNLTNAIIPTQTGIATNWTIVGAGTNTVQAFKTDGTLWSWGNNSSGKVGDSTTAATRTSPVQIGANNIWSMFSTGSSHSVGLAPAPERPYVTITTPVNPITTSPIPVTVTFSEPVTGFIQGDIVITGGTISSYVAVAGGITYTFNVVPTSLGTAVVLVVPQGSANATLLSNLPNIAGSLTIFTGVPLSLRQSYIPASSANASNGSASPIVTGGTTPYTYLWSNGSTDSIAINLKPGRYSVLVTDALGATQKRYIDVTALEGIWATGLNSSGEYGSGNTTATIGKVPFFSQAETAKWKLVEMGNGTSYGIKADSTLWAWGIGGNGQYGNAATTSSTSPVAIGSEKWSSLAAGTYHVIALKADGTIWAWGASNYNQLGSNVLYDNSNSPRQPVGTATSKWSSVAAGDLNSYAIRADGSLWAWGSAYQGQIGNGSGTGTVGAPTQVGTSYNWTTVTSEGANVLALQKDGSLWAWGYNPNGQLGNGNTSNQTLPVHIGTATWKAIAAGNDFSIGIQEDGSLWGWGANNVGQAGVTVVGAAPTRIGTATNWAKVSAGDETAHAITTAGNLFGWGINNNAQVGDSTSVNKTTPTQIGKETTWSGLSDGDNATLILAPAPPHPSVVISSTVTDDPFLTTPLPIRITFSQPVKNFIAADITVTGGTLGTLTALAGDTVFTANITPTAFGTPVTAIVAANLANAYVRSNFLNIASNLFSRGYGNPLRAFYVTTAVTTQNGTNGGATLNISSGSAPYTVAWSNGQTGLTLSNVAAGRYTATITDNGGATLKRIVEIGTQLNRWGWGYNGYGNLGNGNTSSKLHPAFIGSTLEKWVSLSGYYLTTLGIKADGSLWGWGYNPHGEIGDSTSQGRTAPVAISAGSTWQSATNGYYHSAGIKTDGSLWAWGYNGNGQLGRGNTTATTSPVKIGTDAWIAVSAGYQHTIGIKADGSMWAWGYNSNGQLGTGNTANQTSPVRIGSSFGWVAVSSGDYFAVALKADGTLWSWGYNAYGQLGTGNTTQTNAPVQIGIATDWATVKVSPSVTAGFMTATKTDGTLWAWGYNSDGQFGNGNKTATSAPVKVGTATDWYSATPGNYHTIGVKTNGAILSAGYNGYGQLGDNTATGKTTLTALPFQLFAPNPNKWGAIASGNQYSVGLSSAPDKPIPDISTAAGDTTISSPIPVTVTFTEAVTGFILSDLVITNGTGSNFVKVNDSLYTFSITPTAYGIVKVTLAASTSNSTYTSQGSAAAEDLSILYMQGLKAYYATTTVSTTGGTDGGAALTISGGVAPYTVAWNNGATGTSLTGVAAGIYTATITDALGNTQQRVMEITTVQNLWAWGYNGHGQIGNASTTSKKTPTFVGAANKFANLSSFYMHSAGVRADGTLWTWGYNAYGQLGNGTASETYAPGQVGTATNWRTASTGYYHTTAIKTDGTLWAWGYNGYGELGDATNASKTTPIQIGADKWISVVASYLHTAGIKSDGTLWAWGYNAYGQLGIGSTANKNAPVQVGSDTKWIAVSTGQYYTAALKADSTVWAFGWNGYGQLGDATNTSRTSPVKVGNANTWTAISTSSMTQGFTLGLQADSTEWGWGYNVDGQLGAGTTATRNTPVKGVGTGAFVAIANGGYQTMARKVDASLWAWGYNNYGQVGDNTTTSRTSPTLVTRKGGVGNWSAIASGAYTSMALAPAPNQPLPDINSTFGDTTISAPIPVTISFSEAVNGFTASDLIITGGTIKAGSFIGANGSITYSFILIPSGYGNITVDVPANTSTSVLNGTLNNLEAEQFNIVYLEGLKVYYSSTPVSAAGGTNGTATLNISGGTSPYTVAWSNGATTATLTGVAAGFYTATITDAIGFVQKRTIEVGTDQNLWTWGYNAYGELGNGSTTSKRTPTFVGPATNKYASLSTMNGHSMAVKANGTLWAWGYNGHGELGNSSIAWAYSPIQVGAATNWQSSAAGYYHSTAIKTDGTLWAWGYNGNGQLGDSTSVSKTAPIQIGIEKWISVSAGYLHTAAVKSDGTLWTWGYNSDGQLGIGSTASKIAPTQVGSDHDWISVSAGSYYTVALKSDSTVWGFGYNAYGQLGDGTSTQRNSPARVDTANNWLSVNANGRDAATTAAIAADGTAWGWGYNGFGQLGNGNTTTKYAPTQAGGTNYVAIGGSGSNALARKNDATLWAWGDNRNGQLGDNTTVSKSAPTQVTRKGGTGNWSAFASSYYHGMALAPAPNQPLPDISSVKSDTTNVSVIPVTITFSEPVTGFTLSDIVINGGTIQAGSFSGSGTTYTINVIPPTTTGYSNITLNIANGLANSVANSTITNLDAEQFLIVYNKDLILPVILSAFNATADANCSVMLDWKSSTEINSSKYVIQYSNNGIDFNDAAEVKSANSISGHTYTYLFTGTTAGANYFRLKMVDNDGTSTFSGIKQVSINCDKTIITFAPNPVRDVLIVKGLSGKNVINVYDAKGQLITTVTSLNSIQNINMNSFAGGMYYVRVVKDAQVIATGSIVKQ